MEEHQITDLLSAYGAGERDALARLLPLVYDDLRVLARGQLRRRPPGQTLDTTALLHEAYLKLADRSREHWRDREHFMAVAAVAMRHILVDHVRRRRAQKRGGDEEPVLLADDDVGVAARGEEILAVHEALRELSGLEPRLVTLVELRFFAGMTFEEAAAAMRLSVPTVKRDWRRARAFLHQALAQDE